MADFNLNYGLEADGLQVGVVADSRFTHTVTAVADAATPAGRPVGYEGAELSAISSPMKGVSRHSAAMVQTDAGVVEYKAGAAIPLVSFGPVIVEVEAAVNAGDAAYAIISGADKGKFSKTTGATTTTAAVGYFETTTTGAGTATLFVQRGV